MLECQKCNFRYFNSKHLYLYANPENAHNLEPIWVQSHHHGVSLGAPTITRALDNSFKTKKNILTFSPVSTRCPKRTEP